VMRLGRSSTVYGVRAVRFRYEAPGEYIGSNPDTSAPY
jgi:hypothetical protein